MTALIRVILRLLLVGILAFSGGFVWFLVDLGHVGVVSSNLSETPSTDAIIVLTGGSQRVERGLLLLAAGKAEKLFISGVHPGVTVEDLIRLAPQKLPDTLRSRIILGHAADNTVGNAVETAFWLQNEGYHSIRLVTANYHMRRALLEFSRVLPADISIIADAVEPDGTQLSRLWVWHRHVPVVVIEYLKFLGSLFRPLLPLIPAHQGSL